MLQYFVYNNIFLLNMTYKNKQGSLHLCFKILDCYFTFVLKILYLFMMCVNNYVCI